MTLQNVACMFSTELGSTKHAPLPAISHIGVRREVTTARPVAWASMMGIPKPSKMEGNETKSH